MTPQAREFWRRYLATRTDPLENAVVEASMPGNAQIADKLIALYRSGRKTAGSSLVRDYEVAGDPLPQAGRHWILLDSAGAPQLIARTERVEIYKFSDVGEEIARAEGEGDLSLAYWREAHRRFFTPYLAALGIDDLDQALVITEFFTLVFAAAE
jgi:uncharacterized protein YhfF